MSLNKLRFSLLGRLSGREDEVRALGAAYGQTAVRWKTATLWECEGTIHRRSSNDGNVGDPSGGRDGSSGCGSDGLVLLSGRSGTDNSALVETLQDAARRGGVTGTTATTLGSGSGGEPKVMGMYASGKFDVRGNGGKPLSAIADALGCLCDSILWALDAEDRRASEILERERERCARR